MYDDALFWHENIKEQKMEIGRETEEDIKSASIFFFFCSFIKRINARDNTNFKHFSLIQFCSSFTYFAYHPHLNSILSV